MTIAMPGARRPFIPTEGERRIAAAIREARKRKRLTQTEIAKKIGVTSQTLLRYEKLRRAIPSGHLLGLQDILRQLGPGAAALGASTMVSDTWEEDGQPAASAEPNGRDEEFL